MRLAALCLSALLALPVPASAQNLLESYVAFLSANDHYNSRGVRLSASWQIIRQDRANLVRLQREVVLLTRAHVHHRTAGQVDHVVEGVESDD